MIPRGVNHSLFKPGDYQSCRRKLGFTIGENLILFVGRLEILKGIDRMLKGYSLVKDSVPARILILGGDESNNDYKAYLESLASGLGIGDRVSFSGAVPQEELPAYYSAADITIVPSYYESFCLVLLESLACGTPVITSDIGAARQIINDPRAGAVLEANTPEKIAEKIAEYLKPGRTKEAVTARKAVAEYDWNRICGCLFNEYSNLKDSRQLCQSPA